MDQSPAVGQRMRIEVKLSAMLRKGGPGRHTVELPEGSTVAELLAHLSLGKKEVAVVAVNTQYSAQDRVLAGGDEVAIYPHVAGG